MLNAYHAHQAGRPSPQVAIEPVSADTLADSISVDLPRDGISSAAGRAIYRWAYVGVNDLNILAGIAALGRSGIFAEPAGAAAYAGVQVAHDAGLIESDDQVCVVVTGSGLKDVGAAVKAVGQAPVISPSLDALLEHLRA